MDVHKHVNNSELERLYGVGKKIAGELMKKGDYEMCIKYSYCSINIGKKLNLPEAKQDKLYIHIAISFYNLGDVFNCLLLMKKILALKHDEQFSKIYLELRAIFIENEYKLGLENLKNEKIEKAVRNFKKSNIFQTNRCHCYKQLSSCYIQLGNREKALRYLNKSITTKSALKILPPRTE